MYVKDVFSSHGFESINKNSFLSFANDKKNKIDYIDELDKDFISYYEFMVFSKIL